MVKIYSEAHVLLSILYGCLQNALIKVIQLIYEVFTVSPIHVWYISNMDGNNINAFMNFFFNLALRFSNVCCNQ